MKFVPGATLVRQSLASHSWIGVLVGALMYLVCLSGTLAVLYPEFERWEQPYVAETTSISAQRVEQAYRQLVASGEPVTHHMFVSLPTADMPRASISSENGGWFLNPDGSLGSAVSHDWTHMLIHLHLYLHLPETFGMVVVSALGALLCGLVVSGFVAHPRLFKDAFVLRLGGSRHLEQADIHNRLSVWGAPFHLMIGITGAYFGLAALVSFLLAAAYFDGDTEALAAAAYGEERVLSQAARPPAIARALDEMNRIAPEARPFYVTVEEADVPEKQWLIVGARHAGRLIWAEQYHFDAAGSYLGKVGYSDGDVGRQAIFSVYRIHFGHFGGPGVKVLYLVLGLALTVVSVTGINVWLARRRGRDHLNDLWSGFVWGAPPALGLTAIAQVLLGIPSTLVFWAALTAAMAWAVRVRDENASRYQLQALTAGVLVLLVAGYAARFQMDALRVVPLGINAGILAAAAVFALAARRGLGRERQAAAGVGSPSSA
ncbi:MAG: PepSY-associated TM helix domain-containing protein [Pseudomonadales bacterium]